MEELLKKSTDKLKQNKNLIIIAVAFIGVMLLLFGGTKQKSRNEKKSEESFNEAQYIESLEKRVSDMVSEIKGAGSGRVIINIVLTTESVYVKENKRSYDSTDNKSKGETEDSVLTMTDSSGNEYALVTKQIMPQIGGVTVICEGGDDSYVKAKVTEAVCTVLNIGANKVCVIAKAN